MRTLSLIRRQSSDLAFETKLCKRKKGMPKRWGVIVAERAKLKYDRRSLFYDDQGGRLHNYTKLGKDGMKIDPTGSSFHQTHPTEEPGALNSKSRRKQKLAAMKNLTASRQPSIEGNNPSTQASKHNSEKGDPSFSFQKKEGLCDAPIYLKGSFGTQPLSGYGAERGVAQSRAGDEDPRSGRYSPVRRKAFAMLKQLAHEHWDNCKVTFSHRTAFRYALDALMVGHEEKRIIDCYGKALFVCHGLAVDVAASTGELVFFNPSSTVTKARRLLIMDGLTARERIAQWYRNRRGASIRPEADDRSISSSALTPEPVPDDIAELRRKIAESLGCEVPEAL